MFLHRKKNNIRRIHMGLTSKPIGKFQSIMKKMENQLEAERKATKEKREKRGVKK